MKEANPPTHVFDISHEGDFARAIVTRDGCLSIVSSFGNYAFWWPAPGSGDFRDFLVKSGADYLSNSLLYKRHGHKASEREIAGFLKKMWPKVRETIKADLQERPEWGAPLEVSPSP